jgi:hypothetical protein
VPPCDAILGTLEPHGEQTFHLLEETFRMRRASGGEAMGERHDVPTRRMRRNATSDLTMGG